MTPAELGTVLGVWAHPDDEAYLMAGTALAAAAAGCHVACVTATAGEAGETADESRWPQARLGEIRREEMRASLEVLGIDDHEWLGLPDGGLCSIPEAQGVALIGAAVERLQPDTILTFGPDGMTGHPDHATVGRWAHRAAAEVLGSPCRVLAATKTRAWADAFPDINPGVFADGPPCTQQEAMAMAVHLDRSLLERKLQALAQQASQTSGLATAMGAERYRAWIDTEWWVLRPST